MWYICYVHLTRQNHNCLSPYGYVCVFDARLPMERSSPRLVFFVLAAALAREYLSLSPCASQPHCIQSNFIEFGRDDVDDLERIGRGVLGIPWLLIDGDVRLCLFWGPWNHFESNIAIADTISFPFFHAGVTSPLAEAVCKRDYRL